MQMTVVSDPGIPREVIDEARSVFGLQVRPSSILPG
jgi:hypothetical protein